MARPAQVPEADNLLLLNLERRLHDHWNAPIDPQHSLVLEYYTCGAFNDQAQCFEGLSQLYHGKDDITKWKFAIRGARFLDLNEAARAQKKKAGIATTNIKAEFPTLPLPFKLSTLYNRIKPWTYGLNELLRVLMLIIPECTFPFVETYSTNIRSIVCRVSQSQDALVHHNRVHAPQPEEKLIHFIETVPFSERNRPQHRSQLKQLRSRVLVSFPQLHNAAESLHGPIIGAPIPLPCLMECNIKTSAMGMISIVAVLAYVDIEHAVPNMECGEPSTFVPWYDTQSGQVWCRKGLVTENADTTTLHRSLMLHSIQSIRPFQASLARRLLNAKFSSLQGVFDALQVALLNNRLAGDQWHLSTNPSLTLTDIIKYHGFMNHPSLQTPLTFTGWSTQLTFRDVFCWLCWMECNEWQCEAGKDCIHHFATVPQNNPIPYHQRLANEPDKMWLSVGPFELDSRIWCRFSTNQTMLDFDSRVQRDSEFPEPVLRCWNELMDISFPPEWRNSGVHWKAYDAGHPHVDMIQNDLDVQTLCCFLPPDHLHVSGQLSNGNILYYWLEDAADKQAYQVLRAWRGQHPFWNARVHYFEISPMAIQRSPLLKRQLEVAESLKDEVKQMESRVDGFGPTHGHFMTWAMQHAVESDVVATHRLVMERGRVGKRAFLNLLLPNDETIPSMLAADKLQGRIYPLFEVVPTAERRATLNFFVELIAPTGQEWDDTELSQMMVSVASSIRSAVQTTAVHKLYVSSATIPRSNLPRKHRSVLVHSNIVIQVEILPLVQAFLIQDLRGQNPILAVTDDMSWESSIDPVREIHGYIVAPLLQTAITQRCSHCFLDDLLHTSEMCTFHCCHGWLQTASGLHLRGVFRVSGVHDNQELKQLRQSPSQAWSTLSIRSSADVQPAPLHQEIHWTPLLPHELQWQGGHLSLHRITDDHQKSILKNRTIIIQPDRWNFSDFVSLAEDHPIFEYLQKECQLKLVSSQHLGAPCRLLSVQVRLSHNLQWDGYLLNLLMPASSKCCVSETIHQEAYHVQIYRDCRFCYLGEPEKTSARCSHRTCIDKQRTVLPRTTSKRKFTGKKLEALCRHWKAEYLTLGNVLELQYLTHQCFTSYQDDLGGGSGVDRFLFTRK